MTSNTSVLFSENELNSLVNNNAISATTTRPSTSSSSASSPSKRGNKMMDFDAVLNSENTVKLSSTPDRLKSIEVKKGIRLEAKDAVAHRKKDESESSDDDALLGIKPKKKQETYWEFLKNTGPEDLNNPKRALANNNATSRSSAPVNAASSRPSPPPPPNVSSKVDRLEVDENDEDAELFGIRPKKKEMSMAEFLANTAPPGFKATTTTTTATTTTSNNNRNSNSNRPKHIPLKAAGPQPSPLNLSAPANRPSGMQSSPSIVQKLSKITVDEDDEDAELFGVRPKRKEMSMAEFLRDTAPPGYKDPAKTPSSSTPRKSNSTIPPSKPLTEATNIRPTSTNINKMVASGPRGATKNAVEESDEDDELFGITRKKKNEVSLADFLRDSAPPEPIAPPVQEVPKKRSGFGALFGRRKDTATSSTPASSPNTQTGNNRNSNSGKKYTMIAVPEEYKNSTSGTLTSTTSSAASGGDRNRRSSNYSTTSKGTLPPVPQEEAPPVPSMPKKKHEKLGTDTPIEKVFSELTKIDPKFATVITSTVEFTPTPFQNPPTPRRRKITIPSVEVEKPRVMPVTRAEGIQTYSDITTKETQTAHQTPSPPPTPPVTVKSEETNTPPQKEKPETVDASVDCTSDTNNDETTAETAGETTAAAQKTDDDILVVEVMEVQYDEDEGEFVVNEDKTIEVLSASSDNDEESVEKNNGNKKKTTKSSKVDQENSTTQQQCATCKEDDLDDFINGLVNEAIAAAIEPPIVNAETQTIVFETTEAETSTILVESRQVEIQTQELETREVGTDSIALVEEPKKEALELVDTSLQTDPVEFVGERHMALDRVCLELAEESVTLSEEVKMLRKLLAEEREHRVKIEKEGTVFKSRFELLARVAYDSIVHVIDG